MLGGPAVRLAADDARRTRGSAGRPGSRPARCCRCRGASGEGSQDARDVEPPVPQPDALVGVDAVDAEPPGRDRTEHHDRFAGGALVEPAAAGDAACRAPGAGSGWWRAPAARRCCRPGSASCGRRSRSLSRAVSATCSTWSRWLIRAGRLEGQLRLAPGEALPGLDGEQVGAEPVDLGEQPGLRGGGEPEDRRRSPPSRSRSRAPRALRAAAGRAGRRSPPAARRGSASRPHRALIAGTPVSETTRPSSIRIWRGSRSARPASWVIITMVAPSAFSSRRSSMIEAPVALSRFPVGSSASTIAGRPTRARAIATRWRSPSGELGRSRTSRGRTARPARAPRRARRYRSPTGTPAYSNPSATFSRTVACSARKNCWKTNPISRARSSDTSRSPSRAASTPLIRTTPLLGCSRVPMTCSSVDFPDPEGPTIATSSPRSDRERDPAEGGHRRSARRRPWSPRPAPGPASPLTTTAPRRDRPRGGRPATWTRPPVVSNRPSLTATSRAPSAAAHGLDGEAATGPARRWRSPGRSARPSTPAW